MKFTGMFLATLLMVVVTVPSAEARAKDRGRNYFPFLDGRNV